jgi:HK97 gp10 family phage protein
MAETKFQITGIKETLDVFKMLADEIGDKKATSKVLLPAMKEAMLRVQSMARLLAPSDTGALRKSIGIVARRPTTRDKKSQYIKNSDMAIAIVSTSVIPKHLTKEFAKAHKGLKGKERAMAKRTFLTEHSVSFDQRAIAQEFGTATVSAKPFMRPALESQTTAVVSTLGLILKQKIEQYRSKTAK